MAMPARGTSGSVTLDDVEPHVLVNTAQATFTFHVCHPSKGNISSVVGDLAGRCDELTEVAGTQLPLADGRSRYEVIMTIAPAQPGEVKVQGNDLSYRYGSQHGTQRVGEYVWIRYT